MTIPTRGLMAWSGLILLLVTAIWMLVAPDLQNIQLREQEYTRKLALLTRMRALPEEEAQIRQQLEELSVEASARFLYVGDQVAVQSLIQRDLRQIVSEGNLKSNSMRTLPGVVQSGPLAKNAVQISMAVTHEQLISFLQAVEDWEPLLRVQQLSVRIRRPSTPTADAELAVVVEIAGYRRAAQPELPR